ncbi:MAG: SRPBCC family protein [Trichormus sp. ATA11-4-KO1]|jgi:hypothetical protein|nr:SRPBCC family protein [Trichormus sp. ATA11-4-KO1]
MRQTVIAEQEISGQADAIWDTISAGGNVHKWFSTIIQSCQLEGTGEGASRLCTMIDGNELKERIVEVNHAVRRFRYAIDQHPLPAKDVIAFIEVKNAGNGRAFISWGAEFEASEETIPQIKETLHGLYMQGIQSLENYHKTI